jgi:hypothetical protein
MRVRAPEARLASAMRARHGHGLAFLGGWDRMQLVQAFSIPGPFLCCVV